MFIQVIQGRCSRPEELHALIDEWVREHSPQATGWLGGTYGFTDDGEFIGIVRFESRESAMANSGRPEQDAWAQRMAALFDGPIEFHDCDDVTMFLDGDAGRGGFVQVIRGRVEDPDRLKAMMADTETLHRMRPDIVGGTLALEPDGTFTETVVFTDEASAREAEKAGPPEDRREELESVMQGARFYDLHNPWFNSRG